MRPRRLLGLLLLAVPASASAAEVALRWGAPLSGEPASVRVERLNRTQARFEEIALLDPDARSYVDRGLARDRSYCYRIRALSAAGTLLYSAKTCEVAREAP